MQTASTNFAKAVSASSGVWAPIQVHADWANDGYGGDTSIDNLSDLVGRPIQIGQSFDDGMPSDITTTAGKPATATLTAPVGGRITGGVNFTGPQYWSVDNSASPISTYDRDVAAMVVNHGPVTSSGIERVTVFTGQMLDVPVTGRGANLTGTSATRMKLTKSVQPPAIAGDSAGLEATWPVSWALAQCGLYVSPPPRPGCRSWIPMHGSLTPFIDSTTTSYFGNWFAGTVNASLAANNSFQHVRPSFVTGPYLTGAFAECKTDHRNFLSYPGPLPMASGTDFLSKAASAGRVEWWTRGDPDDAAHTPGGVTDLVGPITFETLAGDPTAAAAIVGIDTTRHVFVHAQDGAGHSVTLTSAGTLPTDGAWYFCGAAWDIAGKKLWVNLNGTVGSSAVSTFVTTSLPATDAFDNSGGSPGGLQSNLPLAEIQMTSGAQANPDNYPWINDPAYSWTAGAVMRQSQLQLVGLGEQKPREAWELISSFAQAELAMIRTDELDRFNYLPKSYWAETAQQTVNDVWDTRVNASADFTVTRDPTKIRNQVAVNYTYATVDDTVSLRGLLYLSFTVWTIPPGSSTFTITWPSPALAVDSNITLLSAGQVTGNPFPTSCVSLNTANDGSGTYVTSGVNVYVLSYNAGSAVVQFVNTTTTTYYVVNNGNVPFFQITGAALRTSQASVTVNDTVSQSARGLRGMTVNLPAIQDSTTALAIANELLARARVARPQLQVTLRGDPRRQPGDLATFADTVNTKLGGTWRVMSIDSTINAAEFTQDVIAVKYWPLAVWDQTNWGEGIWGP